jgi:acetyl-CoA carboxylase biotin carboxylase subunit
MKRTINKILIANRGEIACRIIRTARDMGIKSAAVFSNIDRASSHVALADEAINIGQPEPASSYLNMDKIIHAAREVKADAIHPGYGFLSENEVFAQAVVDNGLIFIGPDPVTIGKMGNKIESKKIAKSVDVPVIPGTTGPILSFGDASDSADKIGYPVMIKAAAGGGGKGMRIAASGSQLREQLERAQSEALSSFGSSEVYLEKLLDNPRHIEIQILGDNFGNIIHLFERECSIQRRHQKVIEEAPSCFIDDELRNKMGMAAVKIARKCNYKNAGTVEFMVDQNREFYFLEMNTRLQVEHPVTELITGTDLVAEQIRIAGNEPLEINQENLKINGHALELRIYAENPNEDFLPDPGRIISYQVPKGPGIRIDDGYVAGDEIPLYYDSLIAKLVVWGKNRQQATQRMLRSLDEFEITGVSTTIPFGKEVFGNSMFRSGGINTGFIKNLTSDSVQGRSKEDSRIAAGIAGWLNSENKVKIKENGNKFTASKWRNRIN